MSYTSTMISRNVIASDKFKGSLPGAIVAGLLREGILSVRPDLGVTVLPLADGGEGSLELAETAGYRRVEVEAADPMGYPANGFVAVRDGNAIIELASICGMPRVPSGHQSPFSYTTLGVGQAIIAALDLGCRPIVVERDDSCDQDRRASARVLRQIGKEIGETVIGKAPVAS